jgi:outer membrane protein assembly factor BamB
MTAEQSRGLTLAWRVGAVMLAAAVVAGCSGSSRPKPAPLESFTPSQTVRTVWSARLGAAEGPLSLAVSGSSVAMASTDGQVVSLDVGTGRERWRVAVGSKLSAGVGSDGRFAAVVTTDNELVTLDEGKPSWRERLPGRVITAPLVAGERVFVQSVDRSVRAYDALDGRWLWNFSRAGVDPLALAQNGVLAAFRDTLVTGVGPRLIGLDPVRGTIRFEVSMGLPRGTNEVERLSDLVGPVTRSEDDLCVRSFQLSVGCVNMNRGNLRWSRPHSGYQGLAADDNIVVGADSADRLTAWRADSGETVWRVERFQHRGLSTPVFWSGLIAVGDSEGQLHLLSPQDGRTVARVSLDSALSGAPRVADGHLLVATRAGTLYALRAQ